MGVGGKLIYHGPTVGAEPYFGKLNYLLPKGESVADWLIDISSGRLERSNNEIVEEKKVDQKLIRRTSSISSVGSEEFRSSSFRVVVEKFASAESGATDSQWVGTTGVTTGKVVRYV